jgi:hypothetical protein
MADAAAALFGAELDRPGDVDRIREQEDLRVLDPDGSRAAPACRGYVRCAD